MRPVIFDWPASDRDGICAAQQLGAAGNLVINGVLRTWNSQVAPPSGFPVALMPKIQRTVSIYSAGDISGADFTVTGFDTSGDAVTETLTGPTAGNTVVTTAQFHIVTSVSADAAVASNVEVGTGNTGNTALWLNDHRQNPANTSLFVGTVTGTIDVDVQYTPNITPTFEWTDHPYLTNVTAKDDSNLFFPASYVRASVQSTTTGSFKFTIIQAG
jgi:hypothetical protein